LLLERRVANDRRVVDDLSSPAPEHRRQQQPRQVDRSGERGLQQLIDSVDRLGLEQPAFEYAGVVDQDVDITSPDPAEALLNRLPRAEIDPHRA
jgi:hypothetical protein